MVGCLDLEKAYDRVNREKLFDIMERYGMSEEVVTVLRKIYERNRVRFMLGDIETEWVECTSGVRQGCPLSPLLFNIYMAELEGVIERRQTGMRLTLENEEGELEHQYVAGLLYADDICLIGKGEEELQETIEEVAEVFDEYGMLLSEKKSRVICIGGPTRERIWTAGGKRIEEGKEVKYLGAMVTGGENGGMSVLEERLNGASRTEGMVKFAAARSGSRFIVGREGWKSLVVSKLMYAAGAVAWKRGERQKLEKRQRAFGRWMWGLQKSVRNGCIHGESGWSTFEEREYKAKLGYATRVVNGEDLVAEVGRASLMELGRRSKWWRETREMAEKSGMEDLSNLIALRRASKRGMVDLGIEDRAKQELSKKNVRRRVEEMGRKAWEDTMRQTERTRRYAREKREMRMERYADGSEGAGVRAMVRGDSLLVRMSPNVEWKYKEHERKCVCGEDETERHVLFECEQYEEYRTEWRRKWREEKGGLDMMEGVAGFVEMSRELERETLTSVGRIWKKRNSLESRRG